MGKTLEFKVNGSNKSIKICKQVLSGRTSRDEEEVKKHLEELRKTGVKLSDEFPIFHKKISDRISTSNVVEYLNGRKTSGEVEFALIIDDDYRIYVGVCSDHTDRDLQTYNTSLAKQVIDTVIAPELWIYKDVAEHWDEMIIRSWVVDNGEKVLYQEGKLVEMLKPEDLLKRVEQKYYSSNSLKNLLITGGTFPTLSGDLNYSTNFIFELEDPILNRRIIHDYNVVNI